MEVRGPATVTLSIGSSGPVQLRQGGSFTVHGQSARPSLASNAYLSVTDNVLKDMKRQPWEVRLRGGEPPLGFGVEGLTAGGQQVLAGQRDLMVRMVGGRPGYTVTLSGPGGVVATGSGDSSGEVILRGASLAPGTYSLEGRDGAGTVVRGGFAVADSLRSPAPMMGSTTPRCGRPWPPRTSPAPRPPGASRASKC